MPVTHGVTGSSPVRTALSNAEPISFEAHERDSQTPSRQTSAHITKNIGTLTEWLGSGLQNRVQQFESAGYLKAKGFPHRGALCTL